MGFDPSRGGGRSTDRVAFAVVPAPQTTPKQPRASRRRVERILAQGGCNAHRNRTRAHRETQASTAEERAAVGGAESSDDDPSDRACGPDLPGPDPGAAAGELPP